MRDKNIAISIVKYSTTDRGIPSQLKIMMHILNISSVYFKIMRTCKILNLLPDLYVDVFR